HLTQGQSRFKFEVVGEPLPYKASLNLKAQTISTIDVTKEFGLTQEFDWNNAPVRRIDALVTAQHSHRTAKATLVGHPLFKTEEASTTTTPPPASAAPASGTGPGIPSSGPGEKPAASTPSTP